MPNDTIQLISVLGSIAVSIIATVSALIIAKQNRRSSTITQFRKVWIDNLTDAISTFIAMAETISMLCFEDEDEDRYFKNFKELSKTHNKVVLMLNPFEKEHIELVERMNELREIIHDDEISDEKIDDIVDSKVIDILDAASKVLKKEWIAVKEGK